VSTSAFVGAMSMPFCVSGPSTVLNRPLTVEAIRYREHDGTEPTTTSCARWATERGQLRIKGGCGSRFIWGLSRFTTTSEVFLSSAELLGFTAFVAGLLAKSVLDLIKNLFENVFKS